MPTAGDRYVNTSGQMIAGFIMPGEVLTVRDTDDGICGLVLEVMNEGDTAGRALSVSADDLAEKFTAEQQAGNGQAESRQ